MASPKEMVVRAIRRERSQAEDNYMRAEISFGNQDLNALHGNSGQTRRSILNEYNQAQVQWERALAWVKQSPGGEF